MNTKNFKRVLVWELPVRFFHWINVVSLIVLSATGFLIADPPALLSSEEATYLQTFGTVRFIHFVAAYVFFFNMLLRVYWLFVGNRFSNWKAFELFRGGKGKRTWSNFWHVLKIDLLLMRGDEKNYLSYISIGHNALAILTYKIMFIIALVSIFTGFALYADMSEWWLPDLFAWVIPLFGGDFMVRTIHHIAMWFFIFFTIVHVYLVFYHDYLEGRGAVSSMIGGYKFVREERIKQDEKEKEEEEDKSTVENEA